MIIRSILTSIFIAGMVISLTLAFFGNPVGEYLFPVFFIGSVITLSDLSSKHDCSDHEEIVSKSFLRDGETRVIFKTEEVVECTKCGKRRTV